MAPDSPAALFEMRLDQLGRDIAEIIDIAQRCPKVVAVQDVRTQLLLSYLRDWRRAPELKVVTRR